jgi:hypothetical protein
MKTKVFLIVTIFLLLVSTWSIFVSAQIVERPQLSDVQVSAYWQVNGAGNVDILNSQRLAVTCVQDSTVTSSAEITVTTTGGPAGAGPNQDMVTLASGATQTIYFEVSNGGTSQEIDNVKITVAAYDPNTGEETSNSTVTCNLLDNLNPNTTTLDIHVQGNSANHSPIVGCQLQVLYPASTAETNTTKFTDTNGDVTMNLAAGAGGGYTGQIAIQTIATSAYGSSNTTTYVNSGQNSVTLTVPMAASEGSTQGQNGGNTNWPLIAAAAILCAVVLVVVVAVLLIQRSRRNLPPPPPP